MAKKILFVHNNFPGQFPHIAAAALKAGYQVAAIASETARDFPGVQILRWKLKRGTTQGIYEPATRAEADLLRADGAAEQARALKASGFIPDLIIGHPGWGETLHLSIIFPGVPQIMFGEFFYLPVGGDVGFDREFENPTAYDDMRVHAKNATQSLAYAQADVIVSPTNFQASTFPIGLQRNIRVFHEGVSLNAAVKKPNASFKLPIGKTLDGTKPVITFINRNFERLRGFHIFFRALPAFMAACPEAEVLIIGSDSGGGYGGKLPQNQTWRQKMLAEVGDKIDQTRLHFAGRVSHVDMISALSISWAHVYYTYPFVLSWSLVEAMACQCLILGSDTAPVRDAIISGQNGILNDFFDVSALSNAMIDACSQANSNSELRLRARETALELFDKDSVGLPKWMSLIEEFIGPA